MASRIKVKTVRSTVEDKDIMSMFQSVLGTGENVDLNLPIVYPKYEKIKATTSRFLALLRAVHASNVLATYPGTLGDLGAYIEGLQADYAQVFRAPDLLALYPASSPDPVQNAVVQGSVDFSRVKKEHYDEFAAVYAVATKCNVVNTVVVTCKNLTQHRTSIENKDKLVDRFLTGAGMIFAPLPGLSSFNVKSFYIRAEDAHRKYLLYFLHKLYEVSHDVYQAISAPDIDVEDFIEVVVGSLDDLKKHIPRCDEAFAQIGKSVGLLRENFGDYYKDYVSSNNPTIIMENFVLDVSKDAKAGPKVRRQFQQIINHYRNIAQNKAHDPRLKSLFTQVDANFAELQKSEKADGLDTDDLVAEDAGAGAASGSSDAGSAPRDSHGDDNDGGESSCSSESPPTLVADGAKARRNRKKRDARKTRDVRDQLDKAFESALANELGGGAAEGSAAPDPRAARPPARSLADEFA